ncbi:MULTISPECIES: hypothetical protein [Streptomyces]|uniref:Lipoprotein n=1 Tax=Streptomyces solicathayae TaxID=3081768 RepID=A0ABZ0LT11_9ACTN|nr:hypothetical protein [Streptomyces sp. HUAS YS2]WOX22632.1 hypothetical protein R2D22_14970 [Streptomyces sp. HUAS YS2]
MSPAVRRLLAGLLAAGALSTAPGCASSGDAVDPIERLGRKAVRKVAPLSAGAAQSRHAVVNWHSA